MNTDAREYHEQNHARWLGELRKDMKRALTCARRRHYWMQRARVHKVAGSAAMTQYCAKYAREANRDVLYWMGQAVKDMEFAKW